MFGSCSLQGISESLVRKLSLLSIWLYDCSQNCGHSIAVSLKRAFSQAFFMPTVDRNEPLGPLRPGQ